MTVLSHASGKEATIGFPINGRYSYITLLLDFIEWGVDLPWVRARIARLKTGEDFAELFGDIIVQSKSKSCWYQHPSARDVLLRHCETLIAAWDTTLASSPDRNQLTLEYMVDALKRFAAETKHA
ncbi:hypothetical protein [Thalassococcus lentus]|uniref:Uncharacterized protein n=1 Tax=Thalassococcus lentus TaxID=1210524 RepID=A0ABT4XV28_9RHOB|nr:hypothetical protein [Thalassococcus lentus]MDA7425705.1 hypothetical protein [Thalassococcus lentus]